MACPIFVPPDQPEKCMEMLSSIDRKFLSRKNFVNGCRAVLNTNTSTLRRRFPVQQMQKIQEEYAVHLHRAAHVDDDDEARMRGQLAAVAPVEDLAVETHALPDARTQIDDAALSGTLRLAPRERRMPTRDLLERFQNGRIIRLRQQSEVLVMIDVVRRVRLGIRGLVCIVARVRFARPDLVLHL